MYLGWKLNYSTSTGTFWVSGEPSLISVQTPLNAVE